MRRLLAALAAAALGAFAVPAEADVPAGHTGWSWASPQPQGSSLNAVAFVGESGVAVGERGAVIRTDDGGRTWSGGDSDTIHELTDVAMPAANTVFVGGGCTLRRSDDFGTTFRRLAIAPRETPCSNRIQALAFPTRDVGYVFLRSGTVLHTGNGGRSFDRRTAVPLTNTATRGERHVVTVADFADPGVGLVTQNGFDPPLFRTADGANSWAQSKPGPFGPVPTFWEPHGIDFVSPTTVFAAGDVFGPGMARSDDAGLSWTALPLTGVSDTPWSVDCADAMRCVMLTPESNGAFGGGLIVTSDGGLTATRVSTPAFPARAAAMTDSAGIVVLGAEGVGYRSTDLGKTFTPIGVSVAGSFTGLRRGGGHTLYAFGRHGELGRSTDGGVDWQQLPQLPAPSVLDMSFEAGPTGYVLVAGGGLARTDDSGESWSFLDTTLAGARRLYAVPEGNLLAGMTYGILRSLDGGESFRRTRGPRARVKGFDSGGPVVFAYGPKALQASRDGGASWRALRLPSRYELDSVDFVDARHGWAVDDYQRSYRTTDGGRNWRLMLSPGGEEAVGVSFEDARHGWLALDADPGGLLHTDDGGRTWSPQVLGADDRLHVLALGGGNAAALVDESDELFTTGTRGEAGRPSKLSIAASRRGRLVRVTGRLSPARGGELVSVSEWTGKDWASKRAYVTPNGSFTTSWNSRRKAVFVAQWAGAPLVQGDGTPPLRVRLGRHKRR
jgi:photosystem II stability/assembly factor-like uncharacterized protein